MAFFDLGLVDLDTLNSATKYPSIPTFHGLGERGLLQADQRVSFPPGPVLLSEKVDGANVRVILTPDRFLIGSREELLYAQDDLLFNPAQQIVAAVRDFAEDLRTVALGADGRRWPVQVFYLEAFGGRIGQGSKEYTKDPLATGLRLFDFASLDYHDVYGLSREEVAARRQQGLDQQFVDADTLAALAQQVGVKVVPALGAVDAAELPAGIEDTLVFLEHLAPWSRVRIDESGLGRAEGIVARTPDRSVIAKLRLADYRSTLRRRAPSHAREK